MLMFTGISFLLFILIPINFLNVFLALFISLGVAFHIKRIKFSYDRWYEIVAFVLTNGYLTFAVFGFGLFIESEILTYSIFVRVVIFLIGYVWMYYVFQSALDMFNRLSNLKPASDFLNQKTYWKKWLLLFAITFSLMMLWQRAFNPIILYQDSPSFVRTFFARFSFGYTLMNHIIYRLAPNAQSALAGIAIAQILAFSALSASILMYMHSRILMLKLKYAVTVAFLLPMIPPIGLISVTLMADFMVAISILWITYVIIKILQDGDAQRTSLCIQLCLCLVYMYFIKSNVMVVFFVIYPVLLVMFYKNKMKKMLVSMGAVIALILFVRFPIHSLVGAVRDYNIDAARFFAGLHDMQATYYRGGTLSESSLEMLNNAIPNIEDLRDTFHPEAMAPRRREWMNREFVFREISTGEFIINYADTFVRNPWYMFSTMLHRTRHYWVVDPKNNITNHAPRHFNSGSAEYFGVVRGRNEHLEIIFAQLRRATETHFGMTFFWRHGFWMALLLVSAGWVFLMREYKWLIAYIPVFAFMATKFLTSAWLEYRYGLPIFFVGMFLPVVVLYIKQSRRESYNAIDNR
ncbi:MAG: hypothetical protein FWF78_11465 [Defluviitaleaceae bacterium]|nr:hypothetical protein [Defluviitaleaceae bacterium]